VDDLLRAHLVEYPDQTARYVDPEGYEPLVVDIVRARGGWALVTQDDVGLAQTFPTYHAAMTALEERIADYVARCDRFSSKGVSKR
jgi:dienelactone hydrolase